MAGKMTGKRSVAFTIGLLLVLYIIQAVPMGISAALPLSLQGRGASYKDLAKFSFASLPFSLKLLWAPVVDTTKLRGHGRRKSWLVPVQLLCSAVMVLAAVGRWPSKWAGEDGHPIQVGPLTVFFFTLYVLMATQDIAVDGWALEILPVHLKKHASTCNTIGQSLGFYATNIAFLLFNHSRND
ncbi:putative acetyl-coenzyme A transporter, partial [Gregarina niphandrodes]